MPERKLARSGALHRDRIIDLEARPHHRILVVLDQDLRHPRAGVVDAGIAKNYQKLMAFKKAFHISVWKQHRRGSVKISADRCRGRFPVLRVLK
jgi:hypothetical protein